MLVITMLLLFWLKFSVALVLGALSLFVLLPVTLLTPLRREPAALAGLLAVILACVSFCFYDHTTAAPLRAADGSEVTLTVRVEENNSGYRTLKVLEGDLPAGTTLGCYSSQTAAGELKLWDVAEGTFSLWTAEHPTQISRNILLCALPAESVTVTGSDKPWYGLFYDIRAYARRTLTRYLDDVLAGIPAAICFGDTTLLSGEIKAQFREVGLSHLLVTSGLHVTIIAQAVLLLLRRLRFPRRTAPLVACVPILLFMGICGFGYSILRAGIMQLVLLLAQTGRREADSLNSLGGAMLLIVFFQPYAVQDVGLWLSFGATAGILLLSPSLQRACDRVRFRPVRGVLKSLSITAAALLPIFPITAVIFGELSLVSPLSNLLTVFAAQPLLVVTYLGVLLSLIPGLGFLVRGLFLATGLLTRYLLAVTEALSRLPFATVTVDQSYLLFWLTGSVILIVLFGRYRRKRGVFQAVLWSGISLCAGVLVYTVSMLGVTTVTSPAPANGSAMLFQNGDRTALVLSCKHLSDITGAAAFLKQKGISSLDILILQDENEVFSSHQQLFTDTVSVHTLMSDTETDIPCAACYALEPGAALTGWEGFCAEFGPEGWMRICIGEARVLLCPYGGDTAALPADWRTADLVLFDRSVPGHVTAITAEKGLLRCEESELPYLTKGLPWGSYPITLQTEEETLYMLSESGSVFDPTGGAPE